MRDLKDMEYAPETEGLAIRDVPYRLNQTESLVTCPGFISRMLSSNGTPALVAEGMNKGAYYLYSMFDGGVLVEVYPGKNLLKLSGDVGEGFPIKGLHKLRSYLANADFDENVIYSNHEIKDIPMG